MVLLIKSLLLLTTFNKLSLSDTSPFLCNSLMLDILLPVIRNELSGHGFID